jgi:EthD domain
MRDIVAATAQPPFDGLLDYDGAADWQLEDHDKFLAAFADPYYVHVIEPDENNFIDKMSTKVIATSTMGMSKPIIEGGKAVVDVTKQWAVWAEWEEKSNKLND